MSLVCIARDPEPIVASLVCLPIKSRTRLSGAQYHHNGDFNGHAILEISLVWQFRCLHRVFESDQALIVFLVSLTRDNAIPRML